MRGRSISIDRTRKGELEAGKLEYPEEEHWRPRTRADCAKVERPCPYVSYKHHLYLDAKPNGTVVFNHPNLESWEMEETCALDVAERGALSLEDIGAILGITKQGVALIEQRALAKLMTAGEVESLDERPNGIPLRIIPNERPLVPLRRASPRGKLRVVA